MSTNPEAPKEAEFFSAIRRWGITRGPNGVVGGVIEGVGARIGLARVPGRIIFVVATLILTGLMLLAYAAAWGLLPDREGNIIIQNFGRGVTNVGALIGIGVLLLFGFGNLNMPFPWFNIGPGTIPLQGDGAVVGLMIFFAVIVPLLFLGGLIWLVVYLVRRGNNGDTPAAPPPPVAPDADSTATAASAPKNAAAAAPGSPAMAVPPPPTAPAVPPAPPAPTAPPNAAAPRPPVPPAPGAPGPGRGGYLGMLAVMILAVAAVTWLGRENMLGINGGLAWFSIVLAGLGLILVIVSLTGRKQGFLGFISVPLVVLGLVFAFQGDNLRDSYLSARDAIDREFGNGYVYEDEDTWVDADTWEEVWASEVDPTEYFTDDYSQMVFMPACFEGTEEFEDPGTNITRISLGDVTSDTELDIVGEFTVVTVPVGTNLVHVADAFAQSIVVWPARDLYCEFWDGDQQNFSLTNPDAPTVTLTVYDDMYMNTIVINEVEQP